MKTVQSTRSCEMCQDSAQQKGWKTQPVCTHTQPVRSFHEFRSMSYLPKQCPSRYRLTVVSSTSHGHCILNPLLGVVHQDFTNSWLPISASNIALR